MTIERTTRCRYQASYSTRWPPTISAELARERQGETKKGMFQILPRYVAAYFARCAFCEVKTKSAAPNSKTQTGKVAQVEEDKGKDKEGEAKSNSEAESNSEATPLMPVPRLHGDCCFTASYQPCGRSRSPLRISKSHQSKPPQKKMT